MLMIAEMFDQANSIDYDKVDSHTIDILVKRKQHNIQTRQSLDVHFVLLSSRESSLNKDTDISFWPTAFKRWV